MTPEKALALLDAAVAEMNLNRTTHSQLVQAVQTLQKRIAQPSADLGSKPLPLTEVK